MRWLLPLLLFAVPGQADGGTPERPNILFVLTDDQSWLYAGAYGDRTTRTPAFDQLAREGVLFQQAYAPAPRCTPSRSAILTGQDIWRLEDGGLFGRTLPSKFAVFSNLLERAGYSIGWTGKGWGPGDIFSGGWGVHHPLGTPFNSHIVTPPVTISKIGNYDYARNFEEFLATREKGAPFFFWCGTVQPHRPFSSGAGIASGKDPAGVQVPGHFPDDRRIVEDLLDFSVAVDYADTHIAGMIAALERAGELENTLIVVSSDNGISFPRCKGSLYDMGTRVPLVVRWPARVPGGRVVEDFVNLVDLAPTFLEAAKVPVPEAMTGRSLMDVLVSRDEGRVDPRRDFAVTARDGDYPIRAIRTSSHLYVRNFEPSLLPMGPPFVFGSHVDEPAFAEVNRLSFGLRPAEELYVLADDPWQVTNVAGEEEHADTLTELSERLDRYLTETGDPRLRGERLVKKEIPIVPTYFRWSAFGTGMILLEDEALRRHNIDKALAPDRLQSTLATMIKQARGNARILPAVEGAYAKLAETALSDYDAERGFRVLSEAQAELAGAGHEVLAARGLRDMGRFRGERGELEEAALLLHQSIDAHDRLGEKPGAVSSRELLAGFLLDAGRTDEALVPLGEAYEAIASRHAVDSQAAVAANLQRVLLGLETGAVPPDPELAVWLWELGRVGASSNVPEVIPAEAFLGSALACLRDLREVSALDDHVEALRTMEFAGQPPEVRAGLILRSASVAIEAGAGDLARDWLGEMDLGSGPCAVHLAAERDALLSGEPARAEGEVLETLIHSQLEELGFFEDLGPWDPAFEVQALESEIVIREVFTHEDLRFPIEWRPRCVAFHGLVLDTLGAFVGVRRVYRDLEETDEDFPVSRACMKPVPGEGKLVVLRNGAVRYE